ncbi:MAG TPA: UDP-N-acetylglucosamine--N-acetylmuramyl-(pentapeptide) pyrophosphoryl-undecaprenol N-acetylglucosamine transferase [Candidatus Deferrimicrobiaceae bacterium]|nr:UDP-N-acetylglucosamine--N-acetylmuramyl-(pentapeptide) pyrophosphoryl-undecaprenol N-acetylglucosamine transferase [Candidatus Deferrimicrobiaceae bacterium]
MFPGIALAEAFLSLFPGGSVSFAGTQGGLEARAVPERGFEIDFVSAGQVRGKGAGGLQGLVRMVGGLCASFSVLRRRRPDFVFGIGGYASVPVSLAAAAMGIPLFLQEQNAVPGRSNRMLGRVARHVYTGFGGAISYFPPGKASVSGNPVRREIVEAAAESREQLPPLPPFTVFAMGGSQGARAINELVLGMGRAVKGEGGEMRFLLQTGEREFAGVAGVVKEEGLPVEPFPFTDRIGEAFARCHAVLMRAGALSIAEAALFGKPCVLIPYPFAADRHQERNAVEFCAEGGGVWIRQEEASVEKVREALSLWSEDPERRQAAEQGAARFSRPEASLAILRSALRELGKGAGGNV